jgi:osmotically inducible protein OsmC
VATRLGAIATGYYYPTYKVLADFPAARIERGGLAVRWPFIIMDRKASVIWNGTLREGTGTMTTESGALAGTQYSFGKRFAEGRGTNPDELIAASLGGCFSMALSNELGLSGFHPQRIETTATATLEDLTAGWTVTRIQLDVRATIPDVSQSSFMEAAVAAKTKCPIGRLLNTNISMTASLN